MRDEGLEESVVSLIRLPEIQDSLADLSEAGLDQLLEAGFLRDVPVLGGILGAIRAAGSIRDLLLAKKLGRFMRALQDIPLAEREAFERSLRTPEKRQQIGESLLLLLDRLDDISKPELVARVFRAFIRGGLDFAAFQQMATAIDRLYIADIAVVTEFYASHTPPRTLTAHQRDALQRLSFAGLVRVSVQGDGGAILGPEFAGAEIKYERNDLGTKFAVIIGRDA